MHVAYFITPLYCMGMECIIQTHFWDVCYWVLAGATSLEGLGKLRARMQLKKLTTRGMTFYIYFIFSLLLSSSSACPSYCQQVLFS